jgi:hypothetical protein
VASEIMCSSTTVTGRRVAPSGREPSGGGY